MATATDGDCWIVAAARLAVELSDYFDILELGIFKAVDALAYAPKDDRVEQINAVIKYDGWLEAYKKTVQLLNPPGSPGHAAGMHLVKDFNGGNPVAAFNAIFPLPITLVPYKPANIDKLPTVEDTAASMTEVPAMIVHEVWAREMTHDRLRKCIEDLRLCKGNQLVGGFISIEANLIDKEGKEKKELHAVAFFWQWHDEKFLCIDSLHNHHLPFKHEFETYEKRPFDDKKKFSVQELCLIYEKTVRADPTIGFIDLAA